MQIEDDEILQGFIEESLEHLADIENDLLAIEEAGANIDEDLVNKVFRAAHSIKGGAGFMGLNGIQELSHSMENVLGLIRGKKLIPNPEIVNILLLASDQLQSMIEDIQNSNDVDISSHLDPLNAIAEGNFQASPEQTRTTSTTAAKPEPEQSDSISAEEAATPQNEKEENISSAIEEESTSQPPSHEDDERDIDLYDDASDNVSPEEADNEHTAENTSQHPFVDPSDSPLMPQETAAPKAKTPGDTSLRVHVSLLDQLMNLAGELVLSRNQLLQTIGAEDYRNAETVGQRIDLITSELQEAIMLTRMQPIGNVFNKFPRVVRDLAGKLKKKIDLTIVGKDVELDKTIIESINDPLTHLVRNSVDHGIETP
ncbi:MAG: Hpt domain-containing protein, partial [Desulfopila sp.]|nr:Hpt domain-containing protein [Desulfopila sp.]